MARVFRPKYTTLGPDGRRIVKRAKSYYAEYTTSDGVQRRVKGFPDKTATQALLARLIKQARDARAGLADPYEAHRKTPLADHLTAYVAHLADKGNTAEYVALTEQRCKAILDACRFEKWSDVNGAAVQRYLADLRTDKVNPDNTTRRGVSRQTSNYYLRAVKSFLGWMARERRAPDNPLAHLGMMNTRTDRRHERRALTDDELQRLIDTTRQGPIRYHLDGPTRAMAYRVMCETGFRRGEMVSLTPESFRLDADPAMIVVRAGYSKRRREDQQPIREKLADDLADFLRGRPEGLPVFPLPRHEYTAKMFRADLAAAGIEYVDASGRYADLHGLRHTFVSNLARSGVHPKTAQALARHSTITLTMDRYSHVVLTDQAAALAGLPDLSSTDQHDRQLARATGTYDESACAQLARLSAKPCPEAALTCNVSRLEGESNTSKNPCKTTGFQGLSDGSAERGRWDSNPQPPDRQSGTLTN
jgi:integrase/recombinase XerD